jgi:catechol 2,3-dioxygenase-like lactoylglutathione lyase family enzyme
MLNRWDAIATVAVKDISAAKRFYEGTLGLVPTESQGPGVTTYETGDSKLLVYESPNAGTNTATAVTWIVGQEIDAIVRTLHDQGVAFEHYDGLPQVRRDGDIHVAGTLRMAWLKDPTGNILALISG